MDPLTRRITIVTLGGLIYKTPTGTHAYEGGMISQKTRDMHMHMYEAQGKHKQA